MLPQPTPLSSEELALFNELFSARFGLCFPEHKRAILASRLEPRLRVHHLTRFLDYYLLLQVDFAHEQDHLIGAITNNETYFFRETAQFDTLGEHAIGELRSSASSPDRLRILSAGCSSGEEPYTLRIYASEGRFGIGATIEIDGVDIDPERLGMARRATYRSSSLRALDEDQIVRYFHREPASLDTDPGDHSVAGQTIHQPGFQQPGFHQPGVEARLRAPYRQGVRILRGNLVERTSLPFEPYDIVFCRNVLIYFAEAALQRTIECFASLVRPGGLLFLGHAESIIGMTSAFQAERLGGSIAYRRRQP